MDFFEILYEVRESKGQNQKLTKTNFSEKFSFLGKSPNISPKWVSWLLSKSLSIDMPFFTVKMKHNNFLCDYTKNHIYGKNMVSQLWLKIVSANQILWSSRSPKGIILYLRFLDGEVPRKDDIWDYYFCLGVASCAPRPIRMQDSFVINISEDNGYHVFCMG